MDKTQVRVFKKGQEPDDLLYWLSVPPIERIRTLETIRLEYNTWKYGPERRFQRVYRVVKRKRPDENKTSTGRLQDLADVKQLTRNKK